jgi:hypothetical protein
MLRSLMAIVGGTIVAFIVVMVLEMVEMKIYPPPPGLDMSDPAAVRAVMATIPLGALVLVLVAEVTGAFAGGYLAAFIARRTPAVHALIVGGLVMLAAVGNMLSIPHPVWFWVIALILFLPASYVGGLLGRHRDVKPVSVDSPA